MRRLLFIVVTVLVCPFVATAQPLADRVPDDAIVYIGWQGSTTVGEAYETSHLKAVVDATDWKDAVTRFLPQVMRKLGQQDRNAAEVGSYIAAIVKPMWEHPGAIYFGGVDLTNPRQPNPKIALFSKADADAPALAQTLKDLIAKAPKRRGEPQMLVTENEGLVTLTIGQPAIDPKPLSNVTSFKSAVSAGHKQPVAVVYVDGERMLKLVDDIVAAERNPQAKEQWPAIREATGLTGFKRLVWTAGFDQKEWVEYASIEAPSPRTGLLQFLDSKPISDDIVKTIPVTAVMAGAGRFDFTAFLNAIREGGSKVNPEFAQNYGGAMGMLGGMIGVEVADLVEPLGDQWSYFVDPTIGGDSAIGVVVVNKLDDAAKADQLFAKAEMGVNRTLQRQLPPTMSIQIKQLTRGDVDIHYLATPIVTPAWAIEGDRLYVGLFPQIVASAVAKDRSKGKSILDNPAYVTAREKLGSTPAAAISFTDAPKLMPGTYPMWLVVSRYAGFGDVFGIDSPLMLIPPLNELMPHLTPAAAISWSDEKGWYMRSHSAFPGSQLLVGDANMSVGTSALMASILLPSINRARQTANRVKSASNLRQIGMGILLFSNENKGKYPADFGQILTTQDIGMDVFVSPRTTTDIPPEVRQSDPPTMADWVNLNADYIYKGAGMNNRTPADAVVAYEDPDKVDEGINILFGDGHVEFQNLPQAMETIGK